jgi:outer membrane biosynthesis protein TonB
MTQHTDAPRGSSRPGQMTAVMRAAAPRGPRVLRIGVVRNGRVVEERILKPGRDATVGPSETNLFVARFPGVPSSFKLFEAVDGGYTLHFTSKMAGRVKLSSGVVELSELKEKAERRGEGYAYRLDEQARGKLSIGESTFLFQFVAPPPAQPRPRLPPTVTRGAVGVDWPTTVIAAFSFLVHFRGIGLLYSDWLDPVVDTDVNLGALVESIKNLPPPPELEEKPVEEEASEEKKPEQKQPEEKPKPQRTKQPDAPNKKMTTAEVAALASELDAIDMGVLASLTGETATANVLSDMDSVSTSLMDQAAASGVGVSSGGPGGLKIGNAGGALAAGSVGPGLKGVGATGKSGGEGSGTTKKVRGPKGSASVGGASVAGKVGGASRVVARMRAGFRACYNRGLASNPDAAGRVVLKLKIGPGGEVAGVSASASGNLPASVVACLKSRARSGRFEPPEGGSAIVSVPVTFVAQ